MPNLGGHDYHKFNYNNEVFKVSFGDCEYIGSRRFIDSLTESNIKMLFDSIITNIWDCNRYGVQSKNYDTYLLGQSSCQDFINICAPNNTFWGLVPYHNVCLTTVGFFPYSCNDCRWNIQLEFGSATDFKYQNHDPNATIQSTTTDKNNI